MTCIIGGGVDLCAPRFIWHAGTPPSFTGSMQWYAQCVLCSDMQCALHGAHFIKHALCIFVLYYYAHCMTELIAQYFQFTDMHCTIVCRVQFRVQCTVLCSVQCAMYERLLVGRNVTDYQGVIPGISVFSHNHCPHHRHRYHHCHHHRRHHHRFFSVFHHHFQQGFIHRLKLGPC